MLLLPVLPFPAAAEAGLSSGPPPPPPRAAAAAAVDEDDDDNVKNAGRFWRSIARLFSLFPF